MYYTLSCVSNIFYRLTYVHDTMYIKLMTHVKKIRHYQIESGARTRDICAALEVSRQTWANYLSGKTSITLDKYRVLRDLCAGYGINLEVDDFFFDKRIVSE